MQNSILNLDHRQALQETTYATGIEDTIQCSIEFQETELHFLNTLMRNYNAAK